MTDYIDSADRMLGVRGGTEWKGICPYCDSNRLNIHPIGIAYRPHTIYDFSDLPKEHQRYYKSLPNIVEATMLVVDVYKNTRIIVECLDCRTCMNGWMNLKPDPALPETIYVNKTKLRRYLAQLYGVDEVQEILLRSQK